MVTMQNTDYYTNIDYYVPKPPFTFEDLLPNMESDEGPVIRAAADPNSTLLQQIIEFDATRQSDPTHGVISFINSAFIDECGYRFKTPLLQATLSQLLNNVQLLLDAGAEPNGAGIEHLKGYASRFIRFRTWPDREIPFFYLPPRIPSSSIPQDSPLTAGEINDRFSSGYIARFWTEDELVPTNRMINGNIMHSLLAAAASGNVAIFQKLQAGGADASAWLTGYTPPASASIRSPSALTVSTPFHAAIVANAQPGMISHLLASNFDPNVLPLAIYNQAQTPLQTAITCLPTPNLTAFHTLCTHSNVDFNVLTPLYRVHILHFTVALLSLPLLHTVTSYITLSAASTTALGHTLLHIACLPLIDSKLQILSLKICESIHEVRTLNPYWRHFNLWPVPQWLPRPYEDWDKEDPGKQTEVVKFLLESGTQDVGAQDIHGNTALHYLAGYNDFNEEAARLIQEIQGGAAAWKELKNRWGWTAQELFKEAQNPWQ